MAPRRLNNPFPVTTYHGKAYFCDRKKETSLLIRNIENGNSTTLISIRRMGKTGLIHHVLEQLPKGVSGIYIDILETENLSQFLNKLVTSVLQQFPEKSSLGKKAWAFVKSIRPVISFDMLTGAPKASFDLKQQEAETNIDLVWQFMDQQNQRVVIAIDEFQQVLSYPESNTDAWMRSRMQQLKQVVFIFSGSQQHLMTELFLSPQRPFFRSTSMMKLEKLDFSEYCDFILSRFHDYKKTISRPVAEEILTWSNGHTYYVQQLCNRVFSESARQVTPEGWKNVASDLLKEQETLFLGYRTLLTMHQWQLLKAIAREGRVFQPTGKAFLSRYGLINPATVLRSLRSLQHYQLVYSDFDSTGSQFFSVYDVFFQRWCEKQ